MGVGDERSNANFSKFVATKRRAQLLEVERIEGCALRLLRHMKGVRCVVVHRKVYTSVGACRHRESGCGTLPVCGIGKKNYLKFMVNHELSTHQ